LAGWDLDLVAVATFFWTLIQVHAPMQPCLHHLEDLAICS
jgi:hypothetical protein